MIDKGLNVYLHDIEAHIADCISELDALAALQALSKRDCLLAERLLQMLTEACIGLAKHWVKSIGQHTGTNAYQSFQRLADASILTVDELKQWRRIIGLRNVMVHDYLNINRDIIRHIVVHREYLYLQHFGTQAINALKEGR